MSSSSSPQLNQVALARSISKKRDPPPALDIFDSDSGSSFAPNTRQKRENSDVHFVQPGLRIYPANEDGPTELGYSRSRSTSTTSSLDPYYFGIQSEAESPVPPVPAVSGGLAPIPDVRSPNEPVTPAKDPASIDRRGLVGVGELTTPRWTRNQDESEEVASHVPQFDHPDYTQQSTNTDDVPRDGDSPWTIEAIDGEYSDREDLLDIDPPAHALRTRRSADESGGEEILYPRKLHTVVDLPPPKQKDELSPGLSLSDFTSSEPTSPPTAFSSPARKAKKRTSEEFERDQNGSLVPKRSHSISSSTPKDKSSARKHRSLGPGSLSSTSRDVKGKDRRRDSAGLTIGSTLKTSPKVERHSRQTSTSSSSDVLHSRRGHTTDFSHLPPSPSSSSIQQFLRSTGPPGGPSTPPLSSVKDPLVSPNVAHSLLRGTQEGWSGMDDEATAEALRKLDGLTGKSARARASVGSIARSSSLSRPGTPAKTTSGSQWEGITNSDSGKGSKRASSIGKEKEREHATVKQAEPSNVEPPETASTVASSDEQMVSQAAEKTPKKTGSSSARSSLVAKRGSASSTTYTSTPTTSSRDSATMSIGTSVTSMSAASGRHSSGKARKRDSAGSDISSVHSSDATSLKDRVASLAVSGDGPEDPVVPPVPPLPKDFSTYRSPPSTAVSQSFPHLQSEDKEIRISQDSSDIDRLPVTDPSRRQSQHYTSGYSTTASSAPEHTTAPIKTPSKKWSFSSALNLKLSSSPSSSGGSKTNSFPLSPRALSFNHQLRKSASKDQGLTPSSSSKASWSSPTQPDAMSSAASLASLSSTGSLRSPILHTSRTPDMGNELSRSPSSSANHTYAASSATYAGPLSSPAPSIKLGGSKRLTPSSIPFFTRRASAHSIQLASSAPTSSTSPTFPGDKASTSQKLKSPSPSQDYNPPSSAHKKSSVLSLGLPSLLKSSSRRSLHADSKEALKEIQKAKEIAKEETTRRDKEKQKKEDKDRSESRISVLMGRKRGKTLSSTDPRKPKSPVNLPPMQISALEPATAQRVARLKTTTTSSSSSSSITTTPRSTSSSRLTSQTVSSMQKQSDASLRSTRNQLPTIAGSPSVGTVGHAGKESKDFPPSTLMNSTAGNPKETPTKIPRISSRPSTASSPPLKATSSTLSNRRASTINPASSNNPSPTGISTNEFGVIEVPDSQTPKTATGAAKSNASVRASPSTISTTRVPRQLSTSSSTSGSVLTRKGNRESISFSGLRKSSTGSVTGTAVTGSEQPSLSHRFSALSPSKGLKLLSPKISLSSARTSSSSGSQSIHQTIGTPGSGRQSLSTPSPAPSSVDDEELQGDEEMMQYIRRQHAKKIAAGANQEDLDELLRFPEPIAPGIPSTPQDLLKTAQGQYLCEFEKKEVLDFSAVYYIGAKSKKKMATLDNSTNNHGYDDDRGDYLVINHDHLAYRYEIIDTLGKGSFGQVLHCRDHCTGESVAVKIIRNKKRFHHQALVEIKILDNLRKWDSEEKHHVIKMTEHFYFRNHLCIAMELLSINLYELIKANGFVGFTTSLIRRFTSQMLMSLALMRHHRIVHCDLKPENVLLRHPSKSAIKVIDFGSSCFEHEKIYTYIQSRFYRSPEVILGMNYHMAIDMWSLGCILAELYTGFPIFPGENEQEQLSCIMEVLGSPDKEFINRSSRKKLFFEPNGNPRPVVNSKGRRRKPGTKTIAQVLRCNDEEFVDFISKCLVWDPDRRLKPQSALRHPFVMSGRRPPPPKTSLTSSKTLSSSTLGSRRTQITETPKKSQISGPTPLTSRSSRTTTSNNGVPVTPSSSSGQAGMGSSTSRPYRVSQPQSLSSYNSSRTLSGVSTAAK